MDQTEILEQQAVDAAVGADWIKAIDINKKILKLDKQSVSAYLRLGFCYLQINDIEQAKKSYQKALRLQPGNSVASENLERIQILETKEGKKTSISTLQIDPNLFLEVPGKTKTVALVNLGQKDILAHLTIGQPVRLIIKKRKVEIRTDSQEYIGTLPDDLSRRLLLFLKAKSEYSAYIKESGINRITIFIKEEKKGKQVSHYLSFPNNIQSQLNSLAHEHTDDQTEPEDEAIEDVLTQDLDKMAESLGNEEKEYLPYETEEPEEADEE